MSAYIIAYSYYEKYVSNLLAQVDLISRQIDARKIVLVSTHEIDVRERFRGRASAPVDVVVLKHDNDGWEFGGYQVGIDYLGSSIKRGDSLFVLNDTAGTHSFLPAWIVRRMASMSARYSRCDFPVIVGERDGQPGGSDLRVLNMNANQWIRSCVFAVNYPALEAISWKFSHKEYFSLITASGEKSLSLGSLANDGLETRINNWLFNDDAAYRWPSSVGYVTKDNLAFLRAKALSIVNEKLLSASISSRDGRLLGVIPENKLLFNAYRAHRRIWHFRKKIRVRFGW